MAVQAKEIRRAKQYCDVGTGDRDQKARIVLWLFSSGSLLKLAICNTVCCFVFSRGAVLRPTPVLYR